MIKVSILCITYNHEKFIKQALESFIMQKTNFDFEVIIGEDCSTDNTREIIKEFEKKYPNIIKPVYRQKNLGAMANFVDILCKAEGNYIALCEGDDFFLDENKLQIQNDFLENNPEYSVCFHPVKVFFENAEQKEHIFPDVKQIKEFTSQELLKANFIQTNSVMYINQRYYKDIPTNILPGDWYLHLYHAQFGKIGFIDKIMSAYRRHEGGIWWNAYANTDVLLKKHGIAHLRVFYKLLELYKGEEEKTILLSNIYYLFNKLPLIEEKEHNQVTELFIQEFPDLYIKFLQEQNTELKNQLENRIRVDLHKLFYGIRNRFPKLSSILPTSIKKFLRRCLRI